MTPDERLARVFPARCAEDAVHMASIEVEATRFFLARCHAELALMDSGKGSAPFVGYPAWWNRATDSV